MSLHYSLIFSVLMQNCFNKMQQVLSGCLHHRRACKALSSSLLWFLCWMDRGMYLGGGISFLVSLQQVVVTMKYLKSLKWSRHSAALLRHAPRLPYALRLSVQQKAPQTHLVEAHLRHTLGALSALFVRQ